MSILVTSYENPDIDGFACSLAYSEYLNKIGIHSNYYLFGKPHKEVLYVIEKFSISYNKGLEKYDKIILVDTSSRNGLSEKLNLDDVIEVIDHRKINELQYFPNAKIQIELVGSCATLIAEKFFNNNVSISKESAVLLYFAIISNTINFTNNVSTERDLKMAEYLQNLYNIDKKIINELFAYKSDINTDLKENLLSDMKVVEFNFGNIAILQQEILNVKKILDERIDKILEIIGDLEKEKYVKSFISFVDIGEKCNYFVCIDKELQEILEKVLDVKFENSIAKKEGILMRKEIIALMK